MSNPKSRAEVREIMADIGLPYEAKTAAQFLSGTRSGPNHRAVVATLDPEVFAGGSVFYGHYPKDRAPEVAAKIKRLRRVRVLFVDVIADPEVTYPVTVARYTEGSARGIFYRPGSARIAGRTTTRYAFYSGHIGGGNTYLGSAVRHKAPGGGKVSYSLRNSMDDPIGTFELPNLAAVGRRLKALPSNNGAWSVTS